MASSIQDIMYSSPVIPVITIEELDTALPLASALVNGGLRVLEITLRTPHALAAIDLISKELPQAIVGAGTVINETTLEQAIAAGSAFIVSPGSTPAIIAGAKSAKIPLLPGVNTPTEIMNLLDQGITAMKFFPAEAAGGIAMLKSIAAPLPQALFCPTGGITAETAPSYLALSNVACVGGSWMVGKSLIENKNWQHIEQLARTAAQLTSN